MREGARTGVGWGQASDPQSYLEWGASLGVPKTMESCGSYRNPQTLVEVTSFAAINKFQPFNVAISSNVLFLLVSARSHLVLWGRGIPRPWARGWGTQEGGGPWDVSLLWAGTLFAFFTISKQ